jgi:hypothetical protein
LLQQQHGSSEVRATQQLARDAVVAIESAAASRRFDGALAWHERCSQEAHGQA